MKTSKILLFVLFITVLMSSSFINKEEQKKPDDFIVVIDAGHGGKDPGKLSKFGYAEKDIALKIALQVGGMLEKHPNVKVVYTRTTDVFVELKDRPRIANKANADIFVSIHCNAHHTDVSGTETFVLAVGNVNQNLEVAKAENEVIYLEDNYEEHYKGFNPNSPESFMSLLFTQEEFIDQSILLASLIEKNFTTKYNRKSRGVKQASLWVIHQTAMPSVLIEAGFVTNKKEGDYLNSYKGQTETSTAITSAILEYKHHVEGNVGTFSFKQELAAIKPEVNVITPTVVETTLTSANPSIVFRVQLAATSKAVDPKPKNFNGLMNVIREKEGEMFKYFYGNTAHYDAIKRLEAEAIKQGYKSCFIVAYKEGRKISLTDALKTTAN